MDAGGIASLPRVFVILAAALLAGCGEGISEPEARQVCVPECADRECGDDGCGGSCGVCNAGQLCNAQGACYDPIVCTPDCVGKECGDDGCGGSCGTCDAADTCNNISGLCVAPVGLVWTDSIQSGSSPFGFDNLETQRPIDVMVAPSDANGANLSRVPNPLGGAGYAMRQFGRFDQAGARSQLALWSSGAFGELATSGQAVYIAQEWYFPEALSTDSWGWLALWDWHSTGPSWGENRWHAAPSLNLLTDGSMRVELVWGGTAGEINGWTGGQSSVGLPVGEWFDIEMRYQWTAQTTTITVWVNGELFLEQSGVQTRDSDHRFVETYIKLYGESDTAWSPTPSIKYTRNVRISGERIWQ